MAQSLFKSSATVAFMTFLSRIMGFVRDMVVAQYFGASAEYDAFVVAFKIPNFFRRLFAEGAFTQAFIPILAEYKATRSPAELKEFVQQMFGMLGMALLLVTIIAVVIAPLLILLFAPGFDFNSAKFYLAADMLRITFPYLLLISLTAFFGALLNSYRRFAVPSFTPILLNFAMIFASVVMAPYFAQPIVALAWGVILGGLIQFLFQLPFIYRLGFLRWPKLNWRNSGVSKVLKLMVPAILGVSVAQISMLVDTLFASFLPNGSISWLYFSERLMTFPLGVFGVAIATVILPKLSQDHAASSKTSFNQSLDWGLRCTCIIGIPAAIGLLILAGPLLASLFQYGAFDDQAVMMSRLSLMAYALGVPAFMLIKVLVAGFYAQQNFRTPVRIAVVALVLNMGLNAILIWPLAHMGLALATTLSGCINALLLLCLLLKFRIYQPNAGWWIFLLRISLANLGMAVFLILVNANLSRWLVWTWQERFLHLLPMIFAAVLIYLGLLYLLGIRLKDFKPSNTRF